MIRKIMLVGPSRVDDNNFDGIIWNWLVPLKGLGYSVYFYDTFMTVPEDMKVAVESFKPDLILCILTGCPGLGRGENLEYISELTKQGNVKTFNWFCDDTWRFDNWSKDVCKNFLCCTTPEPSYVEKYKAIGYDNIKIGYWHANEDLYSNMKMKRDYDLAFTYRSSNFDRLRYTQAIQNESSIKFHLGEVVSFEKMVMYYSSAKMGLNLSKDSSLKQTQMKARVVEVPATGALLVTEYHKGIENLFEIDKEIITFQSEVELIKKVKALLKAPKIIDKIAQAGYNRFIKDHSSSVRFKELIGWIEKV